MNRLDRLTSILIKLQSKRRVSSEDIAEHFDISLRTVFRDLRTLTEAGVPIGHEPGIGYYIVDGYYLPPVLFTKEEAAAMLMAGKFVEKQGDQNVATNFNSALNKIKSVLKNTEKDFLESLEEHVEVLKPPNMPNQPSSSDFFLTEIKTALVEHRVLSFNYFSNYNGSETSRTVEPMGLCHYANHWHLIAYCQLRESVRDFRTDRIMKLQKTEASFDPKVHGDYKDFVGNIFNDKDIQPVTVKFSKEVSRYIADQKYYYGLVEEVASEDAVEMTFMTSQLEYFARWLISYGNGFRVISPPELQNHIEAIIEELQNHHISQKKSPSH